MPLSLSRSIRYWRLVHHWTLRDLASRCDFSHTHAAALERGTQPSHRHLNQLETSFGVSLKSDEVLKLQLELFENQATQIILLHQQEQAEQLEPKLKALAPLYLASAYAFDYQFLVTMLHVLISSKPWVSTADEMRVFNAVSPLFKPTQTLLHRLAQAAYEVKESRLAVAVGILVNALEQEDLGQFKGVYHQYLANIYQGTFYRKLSAKQYKEARVHYEQTHNYYRLRAAHLRSRILDLIDRTHPDLNEVNAIKKEALTYGFTDIHRSVSLVLAQNSIQHHRYQDVFEQLEAYVSNSQEASFIQASAYAFLGEHHTVKELYASIKSWQMHPLYRFGFEALLHPDNESTLKQFYNQTTLGLNAFENGIGYRLLKDYYERHRRYKDLLALTLDTIQRMQTSV